MDWKLLLSTFGLVFLAELGDKTQLATLLYAAEAPHARPTVFAAAAAALVLTSALGVLAGGLVSTWLGPRLLRWLAGAGFLAIGLWILLRGEGGA
jgi:putative Ca2+/H+ antiporter (TMEM165/GDT1 family)